MSSSILEDALAGRAQIMPWTVDLYHSAIEAGILPEEPAKELIDGFVVHKDRAAAGEDPLTVGDRHRLSVLRLAQLAPRFETLGSFLQTQQPIALPPNSMPEPDGAVVRGAIEDYKNFPPRPADVLCVIEIADSSLPRDLGTKLAAYSSAGIASYIVVDLLQDVVMVHTKPSGPEYSTVSKLSRADVLRIPAHSGDVEVAVDRLLP